MSKTREEPVQEAVRSLNLQLVDGHLCGGYVFELDVAGEGALVGKGRQLDDAAVLREDAREGLQVHAVGHIREAWNNERRLLSVK